MSRLPRLRGRQVLRALQRAGFIVRRTRGSHHLASHPDGRTTVIPIHTGETIGPGLLAKILRDCELSIEAFEDLL